MNADIEKRKRFRYFSSLLLFTCNFS